MKQILIYKCEDSELSSRIFTSPLYCGESSSTSIPMFILVFLTQTFVCQTYTVLISHLFPHRLVS